MSPTRDGPSQEGRLEEAFQALAEAFGVHARCDSVHPTPLRLTTKHCEGRDGLWQGVPRLAVDILTYSDYQLHFALSIFYDLYIRIIFLI